VAPALSGGLVAAATDKIEVSGAVNITAVKVPVANFPHFVVWIPDAQLPTETARGVLPETFSRADAVWNLSRSALLVAALAAGHFEALPEALRDKIHQDQRAALVPGWEPITRAARQNGAYGATLSGAGPSILIWIKPYHDHKSVVIAAIERAALANGVAGRALELEVEQNGCTLLN
jgi:homoserine kinase